MRSFHLSQPLFMAGLVSTLLLTACQATPNTSSIQTAATRNQLAISQSVATAPPRPSYPALSKPEATGTLSWQGNKLTLSLKLPPRSPNFATQKLDLSDADSVSASVTDSRGNTYTPDGADGNGRVSYPPTGELTLSFSDVASDELLLASVQVRTSSADIPQAELGTALRPSATVTPASATLNFQNSALQRTLSELLVLSPVRARSLDLSALSSLLTAITVPSGTAPNLSYTTHPTLVDTDQLAADLVSSEPATLTATDYRRNGTTVNIDVTGLLGSDTLQVQITDAASAVRTDLGNGTSSGASNILKSTPGSGIQVIVQPFGTPLMDYSYSVSPAGPLTLSEGGTQNLTITATPSVTLTGFTPSAAATGTSITLTGTGFTGTSTVQFSGPGGTWIDASSFTVVSDTQISATVPATAIDGPVRMTKGATISSANSLDVQRTWFVNDDASGGNNGTAWANAFNSLQDALSAAGAEDQIWIAAGTYKPSASNVNALFQMKANVDIHGGFAGNETSLSAADPATHLVRLSGDLQDDDVTSVTPFTSATPNSDRLINGANNAILSGVTVSGAANSGMIISNTSPTLQQLVFEHNQSVEVGGGIYSQDGSPTLTDVVFRHNYSGYRGGGMFVTGISSNVTLTNVSFEQNQAPNRGGGLSLEGQSNGTLTQLRFIENTAIYGAGLALFRHTNATLEDAVFDGNDAALGGNVLEIEGILGNNRLNRIALVNNTSLSEVVRFNVYINGATARVSNMLVADNIVQGNFVNIQSALPDSVILQHVTLANNLCSGNPCAIRNLSPSESTYQNLLLWKDTLGPTPGVSDNNLLFDAANDPFVDSTDPDGPDNIWFTEDDGFQLKSSSTTAIDGGVIIPDLAVDITGLAYLGDPDIGAYEHTPPPGPPANVILVDQDASGTNNGSSWPNAYTDLQSALAAATSGQEIWVAEGTYFPTSGSDRTLTFQMKEGVNLYGGFDGSENARSERDFSTHVTVLSGDLNGDDNVSTVPFENISDNSEHVLLGANNAILDGFVIEKGYAYPSSGTINASNPGCNGGGMRNLGVSPTLRNLIFRHNSAHYYGGGMQNRDGGNPIMTQILFENNVARYWGGGMQAYNASPSLTDVTFQNNAAPGFYGGGMHASNGSTPTLERITFLNNSAAAGGGMMINTSTPVLNNVVFSGNTATNDGGGLQISFSAPILRNITFSNNTADDTGGGIDFDDNAPGTPIYENLLFWNSSLELVDLGTGNGNMVADSNPFVNVTTPNGPDGIPRTADDGLRLSSGASTVINMGISGGSISSQDILGVDRISNPEPGAYEYQP
ncbi:MAG: hypothetical protein ACO1RX_06550 [Candidatus Sericytochromatia bacterium]